MTTESKTNPLLFRRTLLRSIAFFALALTILPIKAKETESLQGITHTVKSFIGNKLQSSNIKDATIEISKLDSRLKLNKCSTNLETKLNYSSQLIGKITVAVHCQEPKPWTIHVPVEVTVYRNVLAAARPLGKGHIISRTDLVPIALKLNQNNSVYFVKLDNLVGKEVKRAIATGKIIKPRFITAARIVRRGESVTIVAVTQSIQVRMKGKALADGVKGQMIRVRNLKTKRVVQGIVTDPGFVKVRM